MGKKKILLVDDEPDILEIISYNLKNENFKVYTADNGVDAINIATKQIPDLILLDVMMPEMDGIETCFHLRELPSLKNTIITFLTARGEDYSQIAGFDAGADDYITKPVKPRVLISKIKALLRRQSSDTALEEEDTVIGNVTLNRESYTVKKGQKEFSLPKKEFELLHLLMKKPGNVYTREEILNKIWGEGVVVGERTIDVHIRKLRKRLGDEYIKTISGIGYKFIADK